MQDITIDYKNLKEELKAVIDQLPDAYTTKASLNNIDSKVTGSLTKIMKDIKHTITTNKVPVNVDMNRQEVGVITTGTTVKLKQEDRIKLYRQFDYSPKFGDAVHRALAKTSIHDLQYNYLSSRRTSYQHALLLSLNFIDPTTAVPAPFKDNPLDYKMILTEAGADVLSQLRSKSVIDLKTLQLLLSIKAYATNNKTVSPYLCNIAYFDYFIARGLLQRTPAYDLIITKEASKILRENYKRLLKYGYTESETVELVAFMSLEELPKYLSSTSEKIRTAATKRFNRLSHNKNF